MKLRTVTHEPGDGNPDFMIFCPGCNCGHGIWVTPHSAGRAVWTFDGDMENPTFAPSLLVTSHRWTPPVTPENLEQWKAQPWEQTKVETVCHSFIRKGNIEFLGDCTHELRGQTVPLPDF